MSTRTHKTFCRYCHAYCPMEAELRGDRVVAVRPDRDNALYGGYTCIKGRQLVEQMYQPGRLRTAMRRGPQGFEPLPSGRAMDEIAARLQAIVAAHGPRAVATYNGTYAFQNSAQLAVSRAWHDALGSPSYYTSVTIDQPAKVFVGSRHGYWGAGGHFFGDADVAMVVGNNPMVSQYAPPGGVPSVSPFEALREAKKRGLKLIAVDPRVTELARRADLHLQIRPGEDATLLAGMLRLIIDEGLHDRAFCEQYTSGLAELRAALEPFTPDFVAGRAGVGAEQVVAAARLFAAGPRGSAVSGTGPEMSPHANLSHHLLMCLNTVCGRYYRAGERLPNPGVLAPPHPRRAEVMEVPLGWGEGPRSRIDPAFGELRALGMMGQVREMPTNLLAEEILLPGEGQVRALIVVGGNPLLAWPDQARTLQALRSLDLLVCVDPYVSATAELAHYLIAPKMTLERDDVTLLSDAWYEKPYSQYAHAVVEADGDVIEEWQLYWGLARRMGLELRIGGLDAREPADPGKFELLEAITRGSRVPLARLRDNPGGHVFEDVDVIVEPGDPSSAARLRFFPDGLGEEIDEMLADAAVDARFTHRLICARSKYVLNSSGLTLTELRGKSGTTNPALLHPDDIAALGLEDDALVQVSSAHGSLLAVLRADPRIRPGVVAMHHSWGVAPDHADADRVREVGANTNRLVGSSGRRERHTGMLRQSAIPVSITRNVEPA
jgi:anaerobic selenocysteine-containing dehydrogenase